MTKVMFLDESGDHNLKIIDSSYPLFVLAGCIFDLEYYNTVAEKLVNDLKGRYVSPDNPYHLCLRFILERAVMYLGRSREKLLFRIESRETHNDRKLAGEYEKFRTGTNLFSPEEIQSKFIDLSFNQKTQNIAGMQLTDLIAYPIGKWVMDKTKENKPFEIVENKLHKKSGKYENYGLKIFP